MTVDYLQFFPARVRDSGAHPMVSQWRRWRGMDVHVHRAGDPSATVKLVVLHGAGGHGRMLLPYTGLLGPVEVTAPDMPGYGLTAPTGGPSTMPRGWTWPPTSSRGNATATGGR